MDFCCCCCLAAKFGQALLQPHVSVDCQAPLSIRFLRQEYWRRLLFPSLRDLPDPGIEPKSSILAGGFFTTDPSGDIYVHMNLAI